MRPASVSRLVMALAIGGLLAGPVAAEGLARPEGEVFLTVSGDLATTNAPEMALFDSALLASLGPVEIRTSTIWTEGVHSFTGIPLKALTDALGVVGGTLRMSAINDYMVEVPVSDAIDEGPILAYEMDGKPMSVRDKGPLWLIYPFDSNSDYRSEVYYSRSIWQLDRIEAVN
ncbi:molybdopterin-dependent oxidoreductase [Tabrizicola oligotrophica]|nr:molybdopterin-dependent oxidoreductase [Tabrizicola oligotrophica]